MSLRTFASAEAGALRREDPVGHDQNSMIVPSAFTLQRAAALSGVSEDQLRAWARAGFYRAHYESGLYSFRDVGGASNARHPSQ
jgi:hypothetical protein